MNEIAYPTAPDWKLKRGQLIKVDDTLYIVTEIASVGAVLISLDYGGYYTSPKPMADLLYELKSDYESDGISFSQIPPGTVITITAGE